MGGEVVRWEMGSWFVREWVGAAVGGGWRCVLEREGGVGTKSKKFFLA